MFGNKLKELLSKNNNKKQIENLAFLIVLIIVTVVVINFVWNDDKNKKIDNNKIDNNSKQLALNNNLIKTDIDKQGTTEETNQLEEKLEMILSKVQGVGEVKVLLSYSESSEVVAMYNETSKKSNVEETDTSGEKRKTEETDIQKDIIYQEIDGEKTPITQKIVQPKIEGAIVIAKGANSADIKTNIIQAIEAVTGLATHKIQVFEMD